MARWPARTRAEAVEVRTRVTPVGLEQQSWAAVIAMVLAAKEGVRDDLDRAAAGLDDLCPRAGMDAPAVPGAGPDAGLCRTYLTLMVFEELTDLFGVHPDPVLLQALAAFLEPSWQQVVTEETGVLVDVLLMAGGHLNAVQAIARAAPVRCWAAALALLMDDPRRQLKTCGAALAGWMSPS